MDKKVDLTKEEVIKSLEQIIENVLGIDRSRYNNDTPMSYLGADSLDAVELVIYIEKEFNISIPDDDAIYVMGETINSVSNYLIPLKYQRQEKLKQIDKNLK